MIERYSRKEIESIWEDYNRYSIWLEIELAAAEAMEKFKIIPKGVVKRVRSKAKINPKRILQIENKVKHDIIAFLTSKLSLLTESTTKIAISYSCKQSHALEVNKVLLRELLVLVAPGVSTNVTTGRLNLFARL